MNQHNVNDINRLMGEYIDLQGQWEENPDNFPWPSLQTLATAGAQAYNEGAGPSFHALTLDGVAHSEFHERFLAFLLDAGFDPFKLVKPGTGHAAISVMSHATLSEAAGKNPASARMLGMLMERARVRFAPLLQALGMHIAPDEDLAKMARASEEALPADMVKLLAPLLA